MVVRTETVSIDENQAKIEVECELNFSADITYEVASQPLLYRVTKEFLRLSVDEAELRGSDTASPQNDLSRFHKLPEALFTEARF